MMIWQPDRLLRIEFKSVESWLGPARKKRRNWPQSSPRLPDCEHCYIYLCTTRARCCKKRVLFHSLVEQTADSISGTWKPSQTYKSPPLCCPAGMIASVCFSFMKRLAFTWPTWNDAALEKNEINLWLIVAGFGEPMRYVFMSKSCVLLFNFLHRNELVAGKILHKILVPYSRESGIVWHLARWYEK